MYLTLASTEDGIKSPGRQAFCAKISDNAPPGRLPIPISRVFNFEDPLPKVGLGLGLALFRTYDAVLRNYRNYEVKLWTGNI